MCGIAGRYSLDGAPVRSSMLRAMADTMVHRGPDDEGLYVGGEFGMTMRRLSIIGVDSGHQPIANEDRSVWTVFNGEIYNYVELRDELLARGHHFTTASDTEVIVHLYEEVGEHCVERLRGMFALAVWDTRTRTLFLARDRVGKKPLYYAHVPGQAFVFGSELKALLVDPSVGRTLDVEALEQYLSVLYVPAPASIFKEVRKLPPAHTLVCSPRGVVIRRYWDPAPALERAPGDSEVIPRFRELLEESVRIRLRSDVPVGAFLSGGLDSSAVVSVMARLLDRPVITTSVGFPERGFSELPYARIVARHVGSEHHEHMASAPTPDLIERLVWHFDEPFADSSAVPTYLVSKAAREHTKVVLSGDGGDELLAGYARHRVEWLEHTLRRLLPSPSRSAVSWMARTVPISFKGRNSLKNVGLPVADACARKFYFDQRVPTVKASLYSDGLRAATARIDPLASFREAFAQCPDADPLSRILYVDFRTYLCDDILTKVDRMSMANSLEVRAPLLDQKLVEFVASLGPAWKLRGGVTKVLLRAVLDGAVPRQAFDRPKHGFESPIGAWFRGPLASFLQDLLGSRTALERGYFEPAAIQRMIDAHRKGLARYDHELWMLLMLEFWHRGVAAPSEAGVA